MVKASPSSDISESAVGLERVNAVTVPGAQKAVGQARVFKHAAREEQANTWVPQKGNNNDCRLTVLANIDLTCGILPVSQNHATEMFVNRQLSSFGLIA